MEADIIGSLIGALPGGGVAVIAVWFALRKDAQCTVQMDRMTELVKQSTAATIEVRAAIDACRDAIRAGSRS